MKIIIRKYTYLKAPLFSWVLTNDQGGSFSNSGLHKSLRACMKHCVSMVRDVDGLKLLVDVYSVDADGNEKLTTTTYPHKGDE